MWLCTKAQFLHCLEGNNDLSAPAINDNMTYFSIHGASSAEYLTPLWVYGIPEYMHNPEHHTTESFCYVCKNYVTFIFSPISSSSSSPSPSSTNSVMTQPNRRNDEEQGFESTNLDLQEGLVSESTELSCSTLESTMGVL